MWAVSSIDCTQMPLRPCREEVSSLPRNSGFRNTGVGTVLRITLFIQQVFDPDEFRFYRKIFFIIGHVLIPHPKCKNT